MALLPRRTPQKPTKQPHRSAEAGISLPFALIIGFAIVLGVAAVAGRANFGMLAISFNQDSKRAREAAETGIARIISELNREHNRPLLAVNPSSGNLWSSADVTGRTSACATRVPRTPNSPNLSEVNTGGAASATSTASVVYINNSGVATAASGSTPAASPPSNTQLAYKLNRVSVDSTPSWSGRTANRGTVTLSVTGYAYTAGKISSSVTVEQTFETVPKCCGLSLGANNNSTLGNDLRSCNWRLGSAYGFIFSTALTDDGSTVFNGVNSELGVAGETGNVDTVVCLRSSSSDCPATVQVGRENIAVNPADTTLNPPPEAPSSITTSGNCIFKNNGTATGSGCSSLATLVGSGSSAVWTIEAQSSGTLPSFCTRVTTGGIATTHCKFDQLQINKNMRILTSNTERLIFYFPTENTPNLDASSADVIHCTKGSPTTSCSATNATVNSLLRFQIYGCVQDADPTKGCKGTSAGPSAPQSPQEFRLKGNSTVVGEPYFIYTPVASMVINGGGGTGTQMAAMIWTNKFTGSGNVEIQIPSAGAGDLLDAFLTDPSGSASGSRPFVYELIARATRAFRLLPGQ